MTNSRLVGIFAAFIFISIAGSQTAYARDCIPNTHPPYPPKCTTRPVTVPTPAICTFSPPYDSRRSTIEWDSCDSAYDSRHTAEEKAKADAIAFAAGSKSSQRGPCTATMSISHCNATCASVGRTPLRGAAASTATFDQVQQANMLFPADGEVQLVNAPNGLCVATSVTDETYSNGRSGAKSCSGLFGITYSPYRSTATADAFCGCMCR
jgi:hypothetical protein